MESSEYNNIENGLVSVASLKQNKAEKTVQKENPAELFCYIA